MIKVSTTGMTVSLKTDLRFPESGQRGHGTRIIQFGQHIPQKDAEQLISKLKQFSYKSLSNRVKHVCYLESMNHTQNNHLYKIIDTIDEAIEKKRKIEIVY